MLTIEGTGLNDVVEVRYVAGLAGNDTFTNATGIGTTAYGGAGRNHLFGLGDRDSSAVFFNRWQEPR